MKKASDQEIWQETLIFFSLHSSVFYLPSPLLKAQQSERPPETPGKLLPFIPVSLLSFSFSPAHTCFFCLPGNFWSFLSHYPLFFPQKMLQCIAPSPSPSLKLCSFLLFSFSSLTWMTVNTVALIKRLSVKTTNNPLSSWSSWPELSITLQIHPSQCNEISYHKCGRWSEILP